VRVKTILWAHCAALFVGTLNAGIFLGANLYLDLGQLALVIVFGFWVVFFLAAPLVLPIIMMTELRGESRWWVFAGAGLLIATTMVLMLPSGLGESLSILILTVCPLAALTYWFTAWRRFPPPN